MINKTNNNIYCPVCGDHWVEKKWLPCQECFDRNRVGRDYIKSLSKKRRNEIIRELKQREKVRDRFSKYYGTRYPESIGDFEWWETPIY
jgi:hypothetical protein